MSARYDVLVIGGAGIDYAMRVERLPIAGGSATGDLFVRDVGGKGLNQAVAAARLGAAAGVITAVGHDREAEDVIAALAEHGVHPAAVVRVDRPTACTLICVDGKGTKQTASRPGANAALDTNRITDTLIRQANVILAQLEVPLPTVLHAARLARQAGTTFILDAAPAARVPDELLALAHAVTCNSEEARMLSGVDVDDRESAQASARAIVRRGASRVAVGTRAGRAIADGRSQTWLPAHDVKVIDTTGAGDACAAGIAVGLSEGRTFAEACRLGHAAAALATTRFGALASLPARTAIEELLEDTQTKSARST